MRLFCNLLIFLYLVLFSVSCKKATNWDIDASIPIAQSHLNLSNFFGDTIFQTDNNHLLHIAFSKSIIDYKIDDLIKLPATKDSIEFTLPGNYASNPGSTIYSNANLSDKEVTFDIQNGVELNKAIIRSGFLKIEYVNSCPQPLNLNYTINSASLWGNVNVFNVNQVIPAGSTSNPYRFTKYYNLQQYDINLTGLSNTKVNTLVQTYTVSADVSGQPDMFTAGQGFEINLSFVDIVPEYVQGYFGQQDLSFGPDSTLLGFLGSFNADNLQLTQSAINFRIINEFGVEMTSTINSVKSIKESPYSIVNLNSGNLLQSININRAAKTNNPANPVFPWVKEININSNNSNLNQFIQNLPDYFGYSVNGQINPLGNISSANDFAYYGHGLKVIADIDIPLALSANYFTLINYSKVDLTQLRELNDVNHCEIFLKARNNYPFKTQLQGYMLNENNEVIDSLFLPGQNMIDAAVTDINNNVLNYVDSKLEANFNRQKIENLKLCKQIKFVSKLFLPNQQITPTTIQLKDDSYLDLTISINVNYNVRAN